MAVILPVVPNLSFSSSIGATVSTGVAVSITAKESTYSSAGSLNSGKSLKQTSQGSEATAYSFARQYMCVPLQWDVWPDRWNCKQANGQMHKVSRQYGYFYLRVFESILFLEFKFEKQQADLRSGLPRSKARRFLKIYAQLIELQNRDSLVFFRDFL